MLRCGCRDASLGCCQGALSQALLSSSHTCADQYSVDTLQCSGVLSLCSSLFPQALCICLGFSGLSALAPQLMESVNCPGFPLCCGLETLWARRWEMIGIICSQESPSFMSMCCVLKLLFQIFSQTPPPNTHTLLSGRVYIWSLLLTDQTWVPFSHMQ